MMAEDFPEQVVDPTRFGSARWEDAWLSSVFGDERPEGAFPESRSICGERFSDVVQNYLGLARISSCLTQRRVSDNEIELLGADAVGEFPIGRVQLTGPRFYHASQQLIRVWLPLGQKAFPNVLDTTGKHRRDGFVVHIGPRPKDAWTQQATYASADGQTRRQMIASAMADQPALQLMGFAPEGPLVNLRMHGDTFAP